MDIVLDSIICHDCAKPFPLPDQCIDVVINSPPYLGFKNFIYNMAVITSMECLRNNKGRFIKGYHYNPKTEFKKGQHWKKPKPYWKKANLYDEYIIKRKSAQQIAEEQGCTESNILYFLKKHKIKAREMSEIRKITYWGVKGKDNPMYNKKGELNPNWKGGISTERQGFYSGEEWKNACRHVWKRDKATCQRCRIKADEGMPLHIHHITSFVNKKLRSDIDNLILLCEVCHGWVHSKKNIKKEFLSE